MRDNGSNNDIISALYFNEEIDKLIPLELLDEYNAAQEESKRLKKI